MDESDSELLVDPADLGLGRLVNEIRDAVIVGEAVSYALGGGQGPFTSSS